MLCIGAVLGSNASSQQTWKYDNNVYDVRIRTDQEPNLFVIEGWLPSESDPARVPTRIIEIELDGGAARESYVIQNVVVDSMVPATPYYVGIFKRLTDSTFSTDIVAVPSEKRPHEDYSIPRVLSETVVRRRDKMYLQLEIPLVVHTTDGRTGIIRSFEISAVSSATHRTARVVTNEIPAYYSDMPFVRQAPEALDTSGTWIDHNETYRAFSIREDGVYRIDKSWLQLTGYDTSSLDPAQVQILLRGQPVPLMPVGFEDGRFDATDGFVFYATRNYDPTDHRSLPAHIDDPYPQFINKYTDSTTFWLYLDAAGGSRMSVNQAFPTVPGDTVDWAYQLVHIENDQHLFSYSSRVERIQNSDWTSEDSFWAGWLGPGAAQWVLNTPYLYPGIPARVSVRAGTWYGPSGAELSFVSSVSVNDSPTLDSTAQPNISSWVLTGEVPASHLSPDKNTIVFRNHSSADPRTFLIDWYELDYPRSLVAVNDQLTFCIDSGSTEGYKVIRVRNFSGPGIRVIRHHEGRTVGLMPSVIASGSTWDAVIHDTTGPGAQYSFFADNSPLIPAHPQVVRVADLRSAIGNAEYQIVTVEEFKDAGERYAAMISDHYGLTVAVTTVEQIYRNYSYGYFNPEAIKLFIYDAVRTQSPPTLQYVLLAGDANQQLRATGARFGRNYVPTYGFPAGDTWFVCFDSMSIAQQVAVGRLPFRNPEQFDAYREKHVRYVQQRRDEWNKTFMFFSSGDPAEGEASLLSYRNVNWSIVRNIIEPVPLAGSAVHFYKTITPRSDLGPYDSKFIKSAIDDGALMISYIGHSGTQTWDNSIADVSQLANKRSRLPLISDFGCSTGKFAEHDVAPFAELFVSEVTGEAIGYIGNSSLGFQSTARALPPLFYTIVVSEGNRTVGRSHAEMKRRLIAQYGNNAVNRIAVRSNVLVGDPIIAIPVADKINLVAKANWIQPLSELYTDMSDSMRIQLIYGNDGTHDQDSTDISIVDLHAGNTVFSSSLRVPVPLRRDTIIVSIPIDNRSGVHHIQVSLDASGRIEEYDENDNTASYAVSVVGTNVKVVDYYANRIGGEADRLLVLNPTLDPGTVPSVVFQFSDSVSFHQTSDVPAEYGKTYTALSALPGTGRSGVRFWRTRGSVSMTSDGPYSFYHGGGSYAQILIDSLSFRQSSGVNVDYTSTALRLARAKRSIQLLSAGFLDGSFGVVQFDGVNYLPNTYFRSYAVVLIDSVTVEPYAHMYYDLLGDPTSPARMIQFIDSARPGTLFAITTADEPRSRNNVVAPTLRLLGSKYIGTLGDRSSWAMIGWRGAATGTVPEAYSPSAMGRVSIDTAFALPPDTGFVVIPNVGPASRWKHIDIGRSNSPDVTISATVLSASAGAVDTLLHVPDMRGRVDMSSIDPLNHPMVELRLSLYTTSVIDSAFITHIGIDYDDLPELAINYQSVAIDSLQYARGDSVRISASVVNAGSGISAPCLMTLDLIDENNVSRTMDSVRISSLSSLNWFAHSFVMPSHMLSGRYTAVVRIDSRTEVKEQHEDNNTYSLSFTVDEDTTKPVLDVTFDGVTVIDGDYVRPRPAVRLTLKDLSPLPVTSPGNFKVVVNDSLIPMTTGNVRIVETIPHTVLEYTPSENLDAGENIFAFNATDASGNKAYQEDLTARVRVSYTSGLEQLYNYPNPFRDQTDFSFLLVGSQAPDRVQIRIYTVSGRKIRTIDTPTEQMRIGYNVVRWDGRDDAGDVLANGVYFFKVIVTSAGSSLEKIGRIAVAR